MDGLLQHSEFHGGTGSANETSLVSLASARLGSHVALLGNYVPRKCGIATFTADVTEQLARFRPEVSVDVYALDDIDNPLEYSGVTDTVSRSDPSDYARAAQAINDSGADVLWLQHEYGIFGGPDGEMVCDLVDLVATPLLLTCHTVLEDPSDNQHRILQHLVARASRIMVMSQNARDILHRIYHAPSERVDVIAHGAPDRPFGREEQFKAARGLGGRPVLTTFGLIGPDKGLETVIAALPAIRAAHPDVVYRIIGATHPRLLADQGETYRDKLKSLAADLGVAECIEWDNRFLESDELLDQLEACDIYLTPYPGMQQSTSGTLSYAVALGKAVVSTPYVHARELLADGVGQLIEPMSASAISRAVCRLLDDPDALLAMKRRAYAKGRETIWPYFAAAAAALVEKTVARKPSVPDLTTAPGFHAVASMSDRTGIFQHAIGVIPDRRHGYCIDDNARALMLVNVATALDDQSRHRFAMTYAAFVQHAWNPDVGRFRNFMSFDRTWCEDFGSEDSNGRTIWALGTTARDSKDADLRQWTMMLYDEALPAMASITSPRAVAFTMLGAAAMVAAKPGHDLSLDCLNRGTDLLERLLGGSRRPDWTWFETMLGYDNPRMPQALIEAGQALRRNDLIALGLETLAWIAEKQTASAGYFRPVGSETFGRHGTSLPFDQQPLEAQAAVEAAVSAFGLSGEEQWKNHAVAAYNWFFGANDRAAVLSDLASGRCRDGLNPRGANLNCGAESILAFQLAHYSMLALYPDVAGDLGKKFANQAENVAGSVAYP